MKLILFISDFAQNYTEKIVELMMAHKKVMKKLQRKLLYLIMLIYTYMGIITKY